MKTDFKNLPSEVENLQQIIATLNAENNLLLTKTNELQAQNTVLLSENDLLKHQLKLLKARRFGRSSEKLNSQIEQLELWIEENDLKSAEVSTCPSTDGDTDKGEVRGQAKRLKLPEHLPREDVIVNPEATCPECGGESFRKIADDISETLEYVPSSFKVIRYIRPRCACVNCEKIVQGYAPSKAIDKGKAGPGLLAHIMIQKYCNHLPIYRQHQIYLREGIDIAQSTMTGWAGQCAKILQPLIESLQKEVFSSSHIHGDDTPIKVLAPGLGKTKTGRIWTYVRDGRPHGEIRPPAVCYFYSPDRKGERPKEHLKDFSGVLHADAYSGYNQLYQSQANSEARITEAACWAHTRRKFYEITVAGDKASIAISVLEQIAEVYKIESEIRGLDAEERKQHREERSEELIENLFNKLRKYSKDLPAKSPTAKAINYALNNEEALRRFLSDGKIEIDNNAAERAVRSIAVVGRKNWLFAGSDNGGHTAAGIYSLVETAKMNNINPQAYLQKVLATIQDYNHKKIADLLPWNIKENVHRTVSN
jgi:transposase